jgi:transposase
LSSKKGGTQNVLGLMTPDLEFKSLVFETKINTETVVYAFNNFFKYKRINEKIVIVLDNAPAHRSEDFQEALEKWKGKNIHFYFLPPYSPELNKIEILWRFIKYSWLPLESYIDKKLLSENLFYILKNIGKKYRITFS